MESKYMILSLLSAIVSLELYLLREELYNSFENLFLIKIYSSDYIFYFIAFSLSVIGNPKY